MKMFWHSKREFFTSKDRLDKITPEQRLGEKAPFQPYNEATYVRNISYVWHPFEVSFKSRNTNGYQT